MLTIVILLSLAFLFVALIFGFNSSIFAQPNTCPSSMSKIYNYTCPSSIYYDQHGVQYRLSVAGSHPNEKGAQIIELHGWIRILPDTGCIGEDRVHSPLTADCTHNADDPPDFTYYLVLDPLWLNQQGTNINQIVRVGNLLDQTHEQDYRTTAPAAIKVELMSWHIGQKINGRSVTIPTGWRTKVSTPPYGDVYWPWDPRYPSNDAQVPLRDGDYVRIRGALVTDFPDHVTWKYPHTGPNWFGFEHNDPNNPARWTEIHPPDLIERIDPPKWSDGLIHNEAATCVAEVAEGGYLSGDTNTLDVNIYPLPKPDPQAKFQWKEYIDYTGGNTISPTLGKGYDVGPNEDHLHVYVPVSGDSSLWGGGAWGKFKACYSVFWEPGPPQLMTTIQPTKIIARVPTPINVSAVDWDTKSKVNGRIIINNTDVGGTGVPFTHTFNSSNYSAKVVAPNYPETPLYFYVNNSLEVRAVPSTIDLSQSGKTNITVYTNSPANHQPVQGKILRLLRAGELGHGYQEIGPTNTIFQYHFTADRLGNPRCLTFAEPRLIAAALGYSNTKVPIKFTNIPESPEDEGCHHPPPPHGGGGGNTCEGLIPSPTERLPRCHF